MNNINNVHNCVGCLSCVDRCPKHCIHISNDSLGHIHTHAEETQCINCGLCVKVAPLYRNPIIENRIRRMLCGERTIR